MTTTRTKAFTAITTAGLLLAVTGCSNSNTTAEARQQAIYMNAVADGSLGVGDGLGRALFTEEGQTRMAMFRTADDAFALAEAKEADGTYDQWYASFIRPGDTQQDGTAIAQSEAATDESNADQPAEEEIFVSVPVPLD